MTALAPTTRYTPEDLLRLEQEGLYELVDGNLVEKKMNSDASKVAWIIGSHLFNHVTKSSDAGTCYPEQTFQCFPHNPDLVRRPDLAFVRAERISSVNKEGNVQVPPDLAIEVISPTDKVYELDEKLADYRSARIPLVWVVDPKARTVRVRRLGQPGIELEDTDTLTGDPVLPGFSIVVSKFFEIGT
jgi:Uma2 family endonuclease